MIRLGRMYSEGQGVPQDYAESMKWYRTAAEKGNPAGQHNLGYMYATGKGVPIDYVTAYMWFSLAATRFPNSAKMKDLTASKLSPAQIETAEKMAREWKPKKEGK